MKKIIAAILVAAIFCLAGCQTEKRNVDGLIITVAEESFSHWSIIMDSETGVQYIVWNGDKEACMSPRYLPDGSIMAK